MDKYIAKTIDFYDKTAQAFMDRTIKYELIELNKFMEYLPAGGFVLDGGCAFGKDAKILSDNGFKVTGIDLSEEFLKRAVKYAPKVEFVKMDMRKLEFPDKQFDGIWCNAALLCLNNRDILKTLKEYRRVLKEKGILFVSFKRGTGIKYIEGKFYNFQTTESLGKILNKAGFEIIENIYVNERERYGHEFRDLDFVNCFARKLD